MFLEEINFYRNEMADEEESVVGFAIENIQDGFTNSIQAGSEVKNIIENEGKDVVNKSLTAQYIDDIAGLSPVKAIMDDLIDSKSNRSPELNRRTEEVINKADEIERKQRESQMSDYGFNK